MRIAKVFGFAVPIILVISSVLFFLVPATQRHLMDEDALVEHLTALLFFAALITGTYLLIRQWRSPQRRILGLLTLLALFCWLDELSFGARFFHWRVPAIFGHKFDGVHDLVDFGYRSILLGWTRQQSLLVIILSAVTVYATVALLAYRQEIKAFYLRIPLKESNVLLTLTAILLLTAIVLDFDIVVTRYTMMLEEVVEMSVALGLLLTFVCLGQESYSLLTIND